MVTGNNTNLMQGFDKRISIFDPSLSFTNCSLYDAVISVSANGVVIVIKEQHKVIGLEAYTSHKNYTHLSQGNDLDKIDLLKLSYKSVCINITTPIYTYIPSEDFDNNLLEQYISLNFDSSNNIKCLYDVCDELNLHIVYAINIELYNNIKRIFPTSTFISNQLVLLKHFSSILNDTTSIFLNIRTYSFDIFAFKNGSFVLGNTFNYDNAQDFIYFVMFVLNQLECSPETLELNLIGEIDKEGSLYAYLYKYIRHIKFIEKPPSLELSEKINNSPYHYYLNSIY